MKKLLVLIIFLIVAGMVLMATCPDREAHRVAVKGVASAVVNAEMDQKGIDETIGAIGAMLGISAIDAYLSSNLIVRDHTFYNVGYVSYDGELRMVSVGVLNHVFTISEEDAKQIMKGKLSLPELIKEVI